MAKLTDAAVPGLGKVNIFSPSAWLSLVLGVVMVLIAFALGQNVKNKIGQKLPIDTTIDPIVQRPQANMGPTKRVY